MQLLSSAAFSLGHRKWFQSSNGIAAAVAVYINTMVAQESLPSWLDVVLPNDEGAFKMPAWIPLACYSPLLQEL
jgi:PiT family inorganic phosphate transporter